MATVSEIAAPHETTPDGDWQFISLWIRDILNTGSNQQFAALWFMVSSGSPAYNEEQFLGRTLAALNVAAESLDQPFEVLVVDDASTDRTAAIACELGARVVPVAHRQIAATRNAGARE